MTTKSTHRLRFLNLKSQQCEIDFEMVHHDAYKGIFECIVRCGKVSKPVEFLASFVSPFVGRKILIKTFVAVIVELNFSRIAIAGGGKEGHRCVFIIFSGCKTDKYRFKNEQSIVIPMISIPQKLNHQKKNLKTFPHISPKS